MVRRRFADELKMRLLVEKNESARRQRRDVVKKCNGSTPDWPANPERSRVILIVGRWWGSSEKNPSECYWLIPCRHRERVS